MHYTSLNALVAKYGAQGLAVLGTPCNQVGCKDRANSVV